MANKSDSNINGRRYRFLTDDLTITPFKAAQSEYYMVEKKSGEKRSHRLYQKEYLVASLMDGKRSVEKVAQLATKKSGLETQPIDVDVFARQLMALNFVALEE